MPSNLDKLIDQMQPREADAVHSDPTEADSEPVYAGDPNGERDYDDEEVGGDRLHAAFRKDPPLIDPKKGRISMKKAGFREEAPIQDPKSAIKPKMSFERKLARRIARKAVEILEANLKKIDQTKPIQDQVKSHAAMAQHMRIATWQAMSEDELVPLAVKVKAMEKLDERAIGKAGQQDMTREKAPIKIIRPQVGDDIT